MPQAPPDPALKALTDWWEEMGVAADPAVMRAYARVSEAKAKPADTPPPVVKPGRKMPADWAEEARQIAAGCDSLGALTEAISSFDGSPLKPAVRNTVVYDGTEGAPVMVIGEGPGAEEDRTGKPFVGRAGQLLDRMLAAIGLSRAENTLITNVNYWRPPGNRNPEPDELLICRPFVDRLVEITAPKLIIAAGGVPAKALLATGNGIMRLRGTEHAFTTPGGYTAPLFPILHPAFLLRRPQEKSRAWRDLQQIEARAKELGVEL